MNNDLQKRIRQRALQIWEAAGRPDGRHDDHWQQAEMQIAGESESSELAPEHSEESLIEEEAQALTLAETTDLSPSQAKELLREHGGDTEKVNKEADNYKAES